jgi:hypothetical protein
LPNASCPGVSADMRWKSQVRSRISSGIAPIARKPPYRNAQAPNPPSPATASASADWLLDAATSARIRPAISGAAIRRCGVSSSQQ